MIPVQRKLIWAVLGILVMLFSLPYYLRDKTPQQGYVEERKLVEINSSQISGFQNGKLSWQITADYIWGSRSKFLFRAEEIHDGKLYDANGELVVSDMSAKKVRVNTKSQTLSATGGVQASIRRRQGKQGFNEVSANQSEKKIDIQSDELKYFSVNKRTYFHNNVKIKQGSTQIEPRKGVEVDNDKNIAYIDDGYQLRNNDYFVSGNQMIIYIDDDYSEMDGGLKIFREPRVPTDAAIDDRERRLRSEKSVLKAESMIFTSKDSGDRMDLRGDVYIEQGDKEIWGNRAIYDQKRDVYEIFGSVRFKAGNMTWLIDENRKQGFSNPDMKEAVAMPVDITCDKMTFDAGWKVLKMMGDVKIVQTDKVAHAQVVEYRDETGEMVLIGDVRVEKDSEDAIRAARLVVDVYKEEFYGSKAIQSTFKVKTGQ